MGLKKLRQRRPAKWPNMGIVIVKTEPNALDIGGPHIDPTADLEQRADLADEVIDIMDVLDNMVYHNQVKIMKTRWQCLCIQQLGIHA